MYTISRLLTLGIHNLMTNLDTYNRVKSLESPRFSSLINLGYFSLVLSIVGSLGCVILINSLFILASSLAAGTTLALTALYYWDQKRPKRCQFCDTTLAIVNRPIILDKHFLSMMGLKEDDYFYTKCRWGINRFFKRWTKISNRSKVCHHCRLTEESTVKRFESITLEELQTIESKLYK
ncbi:MAG: hypothetical protein ACI89U_000060 [Gammaproteobacteria bacterium]|jgi:hypothetical protein